MTDVRIEQALADHAWELSLDIRTADRVELKRASGLDASAAIEQSIKLSEGNAAHIPFRDSKLTRLLQGSLTGSGARIAVICSTVVPLYSTATRECALAAISATCATTSCFWDRLRAITLLFG